MTTFLTYRASNPSSVASSTTVKGTPLTVAEVDANFKTLDNELALKETIANVALKEATANKDTPSGYVGLTAYKVNMKNVGGTVTSWFTNTNTVARTYTLPDKDGTVAMLSDLTAGGAASFTSVTSSGAISATQYTSTIATGTAPLAVTSTTVVTNLNADLLNGQHGSYYSTAGNLTGTIPSVVLGNSAHFIGTTSIALNRSSAGQTLTGISIDGNAATAGNVTGTVAIANGGTGGTTAQAANQNLARNSINYNPATNTVMTPGVTYISYTGDGAKNLQMPALANAAAGDIIIIQNNLLCWNTNNLTITMNNSRIMELAENMTCSTNVSGIKLTCQRNDGSNSYWNVSVY